MSLAAAVLPQAAQAQAASGLPTREEVERPALPDGRARARVRIEDDAIETAPCALDNPEYVNLTIKLQRPVFNNLGPVPEAELAQASAPYLGREQPISVICRVRDAAATRLRALGYIAAVEVPVQRIDGGQVRFEVLYAKVTSIRVIGRVGRSQELFEAYLQRLADGKVFNRFKAERIVLLARDVPGFEARLALKPSGTGAGNMVAEVTLNETPVEADFNLSNLGPPSTGRIGGQLRVAFNGLLGTGDRTSLAVFTTGDLKGQQVYQLGHAMALGDDGLTLSAQATYARTRPDIGPGAPALRARTLLVSGTASYPLVRRQALTVRVDAGLDVIDQDVRFGGAPLSRDRLRVAFLGLDLQALDLRGRGPDGSVAWRIGAQVELRRGVDLFGASPRCITNPAACTGAGVIPPSIFQSNPRATVLRASATAEYRPLRAVSFFIAPRAQIASSLVNGFEQFSLGNFTVGRGFAPGAVIGDEGVAVQAEVRATPFRLTANSRFEFQPYLFSDNGWVWRKLPIARSPAPAHSAGGGLRISFGDKARLDLAVAVPLNRLENEPGRRPVRLLASFVTSILPWGNK